MTDVWAIIKEIQAVMIEISKALQTRKLHVMTLKKEFLINMDK